VVVDVLLIFISWKKGPKYWKTAAPFLYLGLIVISDIILPLMNLSVFFYYLFDKSIKMRDSNFESWALSYAVLCIAKILELMFELRTLVINDSIMFYKLRNEIELNQLTDE